MAMITFSALPTEIQVNIAEYCENNDLINLCQTSKEVNARCLHVLYRHVNLRFNLRDSREFKMGYLELNPMNCRTLKVQLKKQQQFVHTILGHPEYGMYVRSFKGKLCPPSFSAWYKGIVSEEDLWRALRLLTHVQSVDVASDDDYGPGLIVPTKRFPNDLFRSATSVTLVGYMPYGLAKSILNAIDPATLKYLCLDLVQEMKISLETMRQATNKPGDSGEDGRIIALGATSGLLTALTGRCTALRTLILRRVGQSQDGQHDLWHTAAEELSYIEWAAFIRSVQGTVENFTFEQAGETPLRRLFEANYADNFYSGRIMDKRFRQFILPAIVSGTWPCLTAMELRGARGLNGQKATLVMELRAVLGESVQITVKEVAVKSTVLIST